MTRLDWLTQRPVAHRGLHDVARGVIENTPSAVMAAVAANYSIEFDLQITSDGEAMVHHDDALGRLTEGQGALAAMTAADLKRVVFKNTTDRMMTLADLCDAVAGRVTLVIELKSRFDGDMRLPARAAAVLANYRGAVALMSFDPAQIEAVRTIAPAITRGLVAQNYDASSHENDTPHDGRLALALGALRARPQFLAYYVKELTSLVPLFARHVGQLPLLTWTVRTPDDEARARRYADQLIFEGFQP
jgi:glycerophosphoryl diester phosphodiesterase